MRSWLRVALVWSCFTLCGQVARAGNDDEFLVGNQAALAGGAVSAIVSDSSATWYNPAGLGSIDRDQIDVSATAYAFRYYSVPGFLTTRSGATHDAAVTEFVSVPTQVAYARRLAPAVTLGLGYFVPQASSLMLRETLDATSGATASTWQISLGISRVTHTGALGLGFGVTRRVRLGFSLIGIYEATTESYSLVTVDKLAGQTGAFQLNSGLGSLSRMGLEAGVGFQFELGRRWRMALTGRSPRILVEQSSQASVARGSALQAGQFAWVDAAVDEPRAGLSGGRAIRAGRAGVGLAFLPRPSDWLSFEVDVQPGIYDAATSVERRAVVNARLGAGHRVLKGVVLGAGLFTDRTPTRKTNRPITAYGDFYGATLGMTLDNEHGLGAGERARSLVLSSTFALRYAFSRAVMNNVLVDSGGLWESIPGKMIVHEITLHVGGGLSF